MGLKKSNYEIKEMGLVLPEAYAQIVKLETNLDGLATADIAIQQNRECIAKCAPFELRKYSVPINKDLPAHRQVYEKLKENIFKGWEDDIVTEGETDGKEE